MALDDLRFLTAFAKNKSMSRAAVELNTVQSNVALKIRALEEELGVQLFIRRSRGVEPNVGRGFVFSNTVNKLRKCCGKPLPPSKKTVYRKQVCVLAPP